MEKAREEVVLAGRMLVQTGLIQRTWGNVSCRIDDKYFAITPSGRAYETLCPEDIVIVSIDDLSYEGTVKPSSEKGIHAKVYAQKPDVNFVIHTHQVYASVAGVLGKDVNVQDAGRRALIGDKVVLAAYGLPGTKKLRAGVAKALSRTAGRAVLMAHHGALCFGDGRMQAFEVAKALEAECERLTVPAGEPDTPPAPWLSSRRAGQKIVFDTPEGAFELNADFADAPGDIARLHMAVYRARSDINVIRSSALPYTRQASHMLRAVKPLLDDFAQIIGVSAACVDMAERGEKGVVKALKGRYAVLLKGLGALCCAGNADDASAVEMVLEKGCMTHLSAAAHGVLKPISPLECVLMHEVYTLKYAKKAQRVSAPSL